MRRRCDALRTDHPSWGPSQPDLDAGAVVIIKASGDAGSLVRPLPGLAFADQQAASERLPNASLRPITPSTYPAASDRHETPLGLPSIPAEVRVGRSRPPSHRILVE